MPMERASSVDLERAPSKHDRLLLCVRVRVVAFELFFD